MNDLEQDQGNLSRGQMMRIISFFVCDYMSLPAKLIISKITKHYALYTGYEGLNLQAFSVTLYGHGHVTSKTRSLGH